ncbi:MAG: flippase-like domain-containing protein [Sedimentisphaerales bacterium]|nr:flippase-like domain-containing protein [Sedimentisphaerales bacterium]
MTNSSTKKGKRIGWIVRVCVAVGAMGLFLVWVVRHWTSVADAFRRLELLSLAAATLLFMMAGVLIGVRWFFLLRAQQAFVSMGTCIRITFLGMFYNNVLIGSVGGDFLRMWYVAQHTHRRLEAVASVLVDRVLGLGVLIVMATGSWHYFPGKQENGVSLQISPQITMLFVRFWPLILVLLGGALLGMAGAMTWPRTRQRTRQMVLHVVQRLHRFRAALTVYAHYPGTILLASGLTVICQSLSIIGMYLVGRSIDIEMGLRYYFVFLPISWVLGAIPISIGGAGVLEGGLVWLFTHMGGVETGKAAALAICQRFVLLLGSLPGIGIHVTGGHLPNAVERREFFIDSDENVE